MEYIFGAVALFILAIILLLSPVGIHLKGKIILLLLIMIMSCIGFMASTFLGLWQTAGLLILLLILFTFLLSKRSDSFFYESIMEDTRDIGMEYKRVTIPFRMKEDIDYIPGGSPSLKQQPLQLEEPLNVTTDEEDMNEGAILIDSQFPPHNKVKTETFKDQLTDLREIEENLGGVINATNYSDSPIESIDQDLDKLVNRFLEEKEEDVPPKTIYREKEKDNTTPRDLEALFNDEEIDYQDQDRLRILDDDEHIIKEIKLSPLKNRESIVEEESFSPFDLIEEIKEFKHSNQNDKD
jgi:hypothetical protein